MSVLRLPDGATYETNDTAERSYWDGETVKGVVVKSSDELRYTLCCVYPVDQADVAKARDGFRDFASADALRKAAWSYMDNGAEVGLGHQPDTEGAGRTVENYILPCDWTVTAVDGSERVIKAGSWMQGTIWSEEAWAQIKAGEGNGVSMQGGAARRTPSPADVARILGKR